MPRKIRQLLGDLRSAGSWRLSLAAKGHTGKFMHPGFPGAVTLSGMPGDDAKPYQEQQVGRAVEEVSK